jgi:hypothetical protein
MSPGDEPGGCRFHYLRRQTRHAGLPETEPPACPLSAPDYLSGKRQARLLHYPSLIPPDMNGLYTSPSGL